MQFQVSRISHEKCSAEEWEARVDLAAAHRLAVMHGLNEGIFNHLTQVVLGKPDRYYQIPFGMHWSEDKASWFKEVGINDGEVKRGTGQTLPPRRIREASTRRCTVLVVAVAARSDVGRGGRLADHAFGVPQRRRPRRHGRILARRFGRSRHAWSAAKCRQRDRRP